MRTEERLHALDTVRAFALLCGIVLHATMSFMPGLAAVGFPADRSQSETLQVLFYVIHVFRMTLFFTIAGYLAHLVFHRKGAAGFGSDRAKRIVVPLVVGWVLFGPLAMALVYIGLGAKLEAAAAAEQGGFPLSHLWFLYYLLLFYGATLAARWAVTRFLDRRGALRKKVDAVLGTLVRGYAAPVVLAAPIAACLYLTPDWVLWSGIASPDTGLVPQTAAAIGFGTAFVFGWLLHRQNELMFVWKQRWTMHLALAIVLTAASLWLVEGAPDDPLAVAPALKLAYVASYTLAIWNWAFGLIGAALRFFSGESAVRRYLADSSYWLYLAHLPVVFALQLTVRDWPLHWSVKFPLVVGVATALLLLSYHYLVRGTYIGEILNGRSYKRSRATAAAVPSQAARDSLASPVVAELAQVRKRYGATVALDGVDLQVRAGELLALLGPNGAGKSTAVACLLGLHAADEGAVTVFGVSPHAIESKRRIGAMLQNVDLPAELRVRELIELYSSYHATPLPLDELMRMTFTTAIAERRYSKLSGGQKRLVQFAVALCGRPRLLFLDEPTVGLDLKAREMLWATLRQLVAGGCSIVLTTHYLEEAEALADRVAVLAKGKVVALGSVDEVRARVASTQLSWITALDANGVRQWPGVVSASRAGDRLRLVTTDADGVVRRLTREDPGFRDLEIARAGLAQAFTEITEEAA